MGLGDLEQVLRIELDSFEYPWSRQDFIEHLEDQYSLGLVLEHSGSIVAYQVFGIGHPWIRLHSCVVHSAVRRRGIGSAMIMHLQQLVAAGKAIGIVAKVAERNLGAQLFFRQCGFRARKTLHAHLLNGEDVYVMAYSLTDRMAPHFDLDDEKDELISLWEVKHGCPKDRVNEEFRG